MKDRLRAVLVILAATTTAARAAVGTITSADGSKQITLNGMPLYYAPDTKAGDILGQGAGDAWHLDSPSGVMLTSAGRY